MYGLLLFFFGTIGIAIFSWHFSIKEGRYHGIIRFISFECLLILITLNYPYWFEHPFSIKQLMSWMLLAASLLIAVTGFMILKKEGKPEGKFENTTVLVNTSIFAYIRHPLYLSLILLGYGIMFKHIYPVQFLVSVINMITLYRTAKTEEKEMIRKFGQAYIDYMRKTRMFIPFLY